jgi:hypothetical protein
MMYTAPLAHSDSTGAWEAGSAQARADYFGTGIVNCPTTWDTDYCTVYKAGYAVEWNLQKV